MALTLKELKKLAVQKELPMGVSEATFEKVDYRIDEEEVKGVFIHTEEYKPVYLPFWNEEVNYQYSYLLEQLGVTSFDEEVINKTKGTVIKVSRYMKETEKKLSEEELKKFKKENPEAEQLGIEIIEEDGYATVKRIFRNTNFNVNTMKLATTE